MNKQLTRLSVELTRTQLINKALIELLEEKGILTEAELLEQLDQVIKQVIKETTDNINFDYDPSDEKKESTIFNFNPKGEA